MDEGSIWFMTWPFLVSWIGFLGPMVTCHVMKQVFVTGSDFDFGFLGSSKVVDIISFKIIKYFFLV